MKCHAGIGFALVLVALTGTLPGRAADAGREDDAGAFLIENASASTRPGITVRVTHDANGYQVEGRCTTDASRSAAWSVLTDYDGIDTFVSSMRESRVTERVADHLLVEQVAVGGFFLFTRRMTVVLFVTEAPPGTIRFEDVLRHDFAVYRGEWRIEDQGARREIVYRVSARPAFRVPAVVGRGMFGRTVRDLLSQVEAEMVRRTAIAKVAD